MLQEQPQATSHTAHNIVTENNDTLLCKSEKCKFVAKKRTVSTQDKEEIYDILNKIRKQRISLGYSHECMAFQLHVSPSTYTRWENGEITLKLVSFVSILRLLQMNISCI